MILLEMPFALKHGRGFSHSNLDFMPWKLSIDMVVLPLQVSILLAGLAIFSLEAGAFSPSLFPSLRQNQRASMSSSKGGSVFAPALGIRQNVAPRVQARKAAIPLSMAVDLTTAKPEDVRVLVAGCTGYIGRFVTKELIKRGYKVVAFSREKSGVGGKKSMDVRKKRHVSLLAKKISPHIVLFTVT
jgi:hypothetical protein